ncbi:sensor histidine kinase [Desulfosporosinus fructosivorans]
MSILKRVKRISFMINCLQRSLNRELILAIILCLIVSGTVYWQVQEVSFDDSGGVVGVVNKANSAFVEINQLYAGRSDQEAGADYLSRLANYYQLKIAIVEEQGNITLKSDNIDENKLDLEQIKKIRAGSYTGKPIDFYGVYPMKFNSLDSQVIIMGIPQMRTVVTYGRDPLFAISVAITVFISLLILLLRTKVKYIKEISDGILEISKGNLDFRITKKGHDELGLLAENINSMSEQLKTQIEEERKAERSKNELITNVSHDLKTPLTSIIGYLRLVKDKNYETYEQMKEYLDTAYEKSEKLRMLIQDLFEYTKLANGDVQIKKSKINLVELIEQVMGELSLMARENHASFLKVYPKNEVIVEVDSDKIVRAIENILVNAIKYSYRPGEIKIQIAQEDKTTLVIVENSGDTIQEEDLSHLFDRFFRVEKSRTSDIGGSGLGLSIAKSIVKLHDGEIWAESENNKIRIFVGL